MQFKIALILLMALFSSCQEEPLITNSENNQLNFHRATEVRVSSASYSDFLNEGKNGQYYSEFIEAKNNNSISKTIEYFGQRCGSKLSSRKNYDPCSNIDNLNPLSSITYWTTGNNGNDYIDYELEEFFNMHCDYSYTCIRPTGPIIETISGEVEFYEEPIYQFDPESGTFIYVYNYLNSDGIESLNGNFLANYFACKIEEYKATHLPGARVTNVDFYGDALLCNGFSGHFLKATFTLNIHNSI